MTLPVHELAVRLGGIEPTPGGGQTRELNFGGHEAYGVLIWRMEDDDHPSKALEEKAERIVTCVNSLLGIPDPQGFVSAAKGESALTVSLSELQAKHDRLLGFLRTLQPYIDSKRQPGEMWPSLCVEEALSPYQPGYQPVEGK